MEERLIKNIAQQLRKPQGEKAIEVGEKMNEGNKLINLDTIELIDAKDLDKILEIGMGNGFFVKNVLGKNKSVKYIGCDYSESMVKEASQKNDQFIKNGSAEFHLANIENLPFKKNTFHTIFTINTIYFWENTTIALTEISRILKPGGNLIISIRPKSEMIHYPMSKYGFNMFSKEDIIELLSNNKFGKIKCYEKKEPEQEFFDATMKLSSLIISANKLS